MRMLTKEETNNALSKFSKYVVSQAKANLTRGKNKDLGNLHRSIRASLETSKNSFSLVFEMENYGMFQDLGVKGKSGSERAPNSPYRFGTGTGRKGGLREAMKGWVSRKKIQFREKESGRFMSYEATSFLIARAIYHKGLKPTRFFSKPFEAGFERLPNELIEAYGLDVDNFLKFATNEIN